MENRRWEMGERWGEGKKTNHTYLIVSLWWRSAPPLDRQQCCFVGHSLLRAATTRSTTVGAPPASRKVSSRAGLTVARRSRAAASRPLLSAVPRAPASGPPAPAGPGTNAATGVGYAAGTRLDLRLGSDHLPWLTAWAAATAAGASVRKRGGEPAAPLERRL